MLGGKMAKRSKRVTKNDVINILKSIANHNQLLSARLSDIDILIGHYIDYKKDTEGFTEYIDGKYKQQKDIGSGTDATASEE